MTSHASFIVYVPQSTDEILMKSVADVVGSDASSLCIGMSGSASSAADAAGDAGAAPRAASAVSASAVTTPPSTSVRRRRGSSEAARGSAAASTLPYSVIPVYHKESAVIYPN